MVNPSVTRWRELRRLVLNHIFKKKICGQCLRNDDWGGGRGSIVVCHGGVD